jgi:hypothetical protein
LPGHAWRTPMGGGRRSCGGEKAWRLGLDREGWPLRQGREEIGVALWICDAPGPAWRVRGGKGRTKRATLCGTTKLFDVLRCGRIRNMFLLFK